MIMMMMMKKENKILYNFISFQNVQLIESGLKIKKLGYAVLSRTQNEKNKNNFAQNLNKEI